VGSVCDTASEDLLYSATSGHARSEAALVSSEVLLEMVDRRLTILPNLDEIPVRIAHVTSQLMAVIIERFGQELGALRLPLGITSPNVGDAKVQEAAYGVQVMRGLKDHFGLVRRRPPAGVENDPRVDQLDVTGILRPYHFSSEDSNVELPGFYLVPYGQEVSDEKALLGNWGVGQIHRTSTNVILNDEVKMALKHGANTAL
jgi:hypothetical protein